MANIIEKTFADVSAFDAYLTALATDPTAISNKSAATAAWNNIQIALANTNPNGASVSHTSTSVTVNLPSGGVLKAGGTGFVAPYTNASLTNASLTSIDYSGPEGKLTLNGYIKFNQTGPWGGSLTKLSVTDALTGDMLSYTGNLAVWSYDIVNPFNPWSVYQKHLVNGNVTSITAKVAGVTFAASGNLTITDSLVGNPPYYDYIKNDIATLGGTLNAVSVKDSQGHEFSMTGLNISGSGLQSLANSRIGALSLFFDGNDTVTGGPGDDMLFSGAGNDTIDGGAGVDTLIVHGAKSAYKIAVPKVGVVTLTANDGSTATLTNVEKVIFVPSADMFIPSGGLPDSTYTTAKPADSTDPNIPTDYSHWLLYNVATPLGGTLVTDTSGATLAGGVGNDTLIANAPNVILDGGAGNDTFIVNATGVQIHKDAPSNGVINSKVIVTIPTFTLPDNIKELDYKGTADFTGIGNDGSNVIVGNIGNDVLDGGAGKGADTLIGGAGNDTYIVHSTSDKVVEKSDEGSQDQVKTDLNSYSLSKPALAEIENLSYAGAGDFTGIGNAKDNIITGGSGDNNLDGGAGNDTVILDGTRAAYNITVIKGVSSTKAFYTPTGMQPGDIIQLIYKDKDGNSHTDKVAGIENFKFKGDDSPIAANAQAGGLLYNIATYHDDTLTGTAGADEFHGGDGNDIINGLAGNDSLFGDAGNDFLDGGTGSDTLSPDISYSRRAKAYFPPPPH